jgi:hypothetical protein
MAKCLVIPIIKALLFGKLPPALNQVQIGRIRGQKKEVDAQCLGLLRHLVAPLITGVVHDERQGDVSVFLLDLDEQVHHRVGVDVGIIGYGDQVVPFTLKVPQTW